MENVLQEANPRLQQMWENFVEKFDITYDLHELGGLDARHLFGQTMRFLQHFHDELDAYAQRYPDQLSADSLSAAKGRMDTLEMDLSRYSGVAHSMSHPRGR